MLSGILVKVNGIAVLVPVVVVSVADVVWSPPLSITVPKLIKFLLV